jgi:hypothetical protein
MDLMPASFDYGKPGPFKAALDAYQDNVNANQLLDDHLTLLRSNFDQIFAEWRQYGFNDYQIALMLGIACGNSSTTEMIACMLALQNHDQ